MKETRHRIRLQQLLISPHSIHIFLKLIIFNLLWLVSLFIPVYNTVLVDGRAPGTAKTHMVHM